VSKRAFFFACIYIFSFVFLILTLNYNVRTFRLTQELQSLTLELQAIERDVELKELNYYQQTSLDKVHDVAANQLGMIRQNRIRVFSTDEVQSR
tara:strand:- start:3335 stop:3616 length:282 start_codon:yes stop_codon:yes gene_type:complete